MLPPSDKDALYYAESYYDLTKVTVVRTRELDMYHDEIWAVGIPNKAWEYFATFTEAISFAFEQIEE